MQTIHYTTRDRSAWGSGPWDGEPDKVQWGDPETGLPCLAVRNMVGAWCGHVGVPAAHPLHGVDYSETNEDFDVHGGLTFSDHCGAGPEDQEICHVPGDGETDRVWWLGFDCAHVGDAWPASTPWGGVGTYRTLVYVQLECSKLARHLDAIARES